MSRRFSPSVGESARSTDAAMPSSLERVFPVLLLLLLTAGCFDEPTAPDEGAEVEESRAVEPSQGVQGLVGQPTFLELADQIPTFGGFFFNEQGDIVVYLTDPEQLDVVRPLIQEKVAGRLNGLESPAGMGQRFVVREADYPFRELADYRTRAREELFAIDGVVSLGVDETRNRIRIGVTGMAAQERVIDLIRELDIPESAVVFRETSHPSATSHTVGDQHPEEKIEGGWRIERPNLGGFCTLGFPAVRDPGGEEVFLTASHCTDVRLGPDDSEWFQPGTVYPPRIGIETEDPPYFTCDLTGRPCRRSDVAFITAEKAFDLGTVARTGSSGGTCCSGSLQINHDNPRWIATGQSNDNFVGERVDKVGQKTGWTNGDVEATCETVSVDEDDDGTGDYIILCSDRAAYHTDGQDSGSPVFFIHSSGDIDMRGIHFASNGWFSPLRQIEKEFDQVIAYETPTVGVTINGPTSVPPDSECSWTADVSPGLPPYSYEWRRDGSLVSTGDSYTGNSGNSDFNLDLQVTDARNDIAGDFISVTISSEEGGESGSCPS